MARSFGSQGSDEVDFGASVPALYNQTAASVMCWFKMATCPSTGNWPCVVHQYADWNINWRVEFKALAGADLGKIQVHWRTPAQYTGFLSTNAWDDDAWHRLLLVRRNSSPYTQLYIDGVSDGSQTSDPLTNSTSPTGHEWGNYNGNSGLGGSLARCALVAGTALTPQQADGFLYTARLPVALDNWYEMLGGSPEPDWSGGGNNGTITGTTLVAHAPVRLARPTLAFPYVVAVAARRIFVTHT